MRKRRLKAQGVRLKGKKLDWVLSVISDPLMVVCVRV